MATVEFASEDLRLALAAALVAKSSDTTRPHIHGVLVDLAPASGPPSTRNGDRAVIVGTDGHMMAKLEIYCTLDGVGSRELLLHGDDVGELVKALGKVKPPKSTTKDKRATGPGGPTTTAELDTSCAPDAVRFKVGGKTITVRLIDAKFPPYASLFPKPGELGPIGWIGIGNGVLGKALAVIKALGSAGGTWRFSSEDEIGPIVVTPSTTGAPVSAIILLMPMRVDPPRSGAKHTDGAKAAKRATATAVERELMAARDAAAAAESREAAAAAESAERMTARDAARGPYSHPKAARKPAKSAKSAPAAAATHVVAMDWAGVKNNRGASFSTFADANRAAMDSAIKHGKRVTVYTVAGVPVASYERGETGAVAVDVEPRTNPKTPWDEDDAAKQVRETLRRVAKLTATRASGAEYGDQDARKKLASAGSRAFDKLHNSARFLSPANYAAAEAQIAHAWRAWLDSEETGRAAWRAGNDAEIAKHTRAMYLARPAPGTYEHELAMMSAGRPRKNPKPRRAAKNTIREGGRAKIAYHDVYANGQHVPAGTVVKVESIYPTFGEAVVTHNNRYFRIGLEALMSAGPRA